MNERCQAEYVMLRKTSSVVAAHIPAAHAKVTVVIVSTITGNIRNSPDVSSQRMLRRPSIGL
jgi:hypothetical protein